MQIENVVPRNESPANKVIVDSIEQVLDAVNGVTLSHLNPTQLL
jgi:hypothetical protein